jgi:hypothetical protein
MKKSILLVLFVFAFTLLYQNLLAQNEVPEQIRYNGTLTDSSNNLVEGTRTLRFRLYDSFSGGAQLWVDTYSDVAIKSGAFSVILGESTPLPANLSGEVYLQIEIERSSEWEVLLPRLRVTGAVYSIVTQSSENIGSCPGDMFWTGSFCIDKSMSPSKMSIMDALDYCVSKERRICRTYELQLACRNKGSWDINDMTSHASYLDYEWTADKGQKGKAMIPNYYQPNLYITGFNCNVAKDVRPGKTDVQYIDPLVWCYENSLSEPSGEWCKVRAHVRCCK